MKRCINLSIGETTIEKIIDISIDTSYLIGAYSMYRTPGSIVRASKKFSEDYGENEHIPTMNDHTYPYFSPPDNGEAVGSPEYRKCAMQDYLRAEAYNNGQWDYLTVQITTEIKSDLYGLHTHVSDSICAIESDSDPKYIESRISDLKYEIEKILLSMGFSKVEIQKSFSSATVKE